MKRMILIMALVSILPFSVTVFADGHGKKGRNHYEEQDREAGKHHGEQEQEQRKHHKKRDKENHKYKSHRKMPKDWRKRVAKGHRLDDEMYMYLRPVPVDVIHSLPPLPPGVSYRQIENDIIKLKTVNREILDVLVPKNIPIPPLPIPPLPGIK